MEEIWHCSKKKRFEWTKNCTIGVGQKIWMLFLKAQSSCYFQQEAFWECFEVSRKVWESFVNMPLYFAATVLLTMIFNSVYFAMPSITNYKFASECFTICTHPWPLTSHRIRKNDKEIEKYFHGEKRGRNLKESNRGGSLSRMDISK